MRGRRGIAQLLVLWALALLGTLALGFSYSMRTEALAARNGIDETRAYFQARTGVERTLKLLATLPPDNVMRMEIGGTDEDASYVVRVTSESGKVNLNFVSGETLLGMLKTAGLPDEEAEGIRDAILDWRDEDDVTGPRGAEAGDYARLPEPIRPRNGKFRSVEELRYVMGVTPVLYDRFLSLVFTVQGNSPRVNYLRAPAEVLRSIPGVSPGAVDRIVAGRSEDPPISAANLAAMVGEGLLTAEGLAMITGGDTSSAFTITAIGTSGGDVTQVVRCLAQFTGGGRKAIKILEWREKAPLEVGG